MGFALSLPLALNVAVRNVRTATGDFSGAVGMSVFLKPGVTEAKARQLAYVAGERVGVASVTLITAAQALEEFRRESGFGAALGALSDNPLPHVLAIRPTAAAASSQQLDALRDYLAGWPEVDSVQLDRDWVLRFNALLDLLRESLWVAAALLGVGVVTIVGNTIRLEIRSRRAEIEVTKLVGGSNAFVRRPFLYAGTLTGLAAGLIAFGVVAIGKIALAAPAQRLAIAYGSQYVLQGPNATELGVLLLAGAALGWLGAWVASAGQLAGIEPKTT